MIDFDDADRLLHIFGYWQRENPGGTLADRDKWLREVALPELARAASQERPQPCDRIVNNGMGEPTECGHSWPCEYHDPPQERPSIDVERLRITVGPNNPPHYTDGWNDALDEVARLLSGPVGE